MVFEHTAEDLDQHFADASQAVPLPTGQTVLLDSRDPINRITRRVIDRSSLLRGRLDGSVTRIPKLSQFLFTGAAFRGLVVAYLDAAGWSNRSALTTQHEVAATSNIAAAIVVLSRKMIPWNEIHAAPAQRVGAARMAELRANYVNLQSAGLSLLGKALGNADPKTPAGTTKVAELVAHLDWSREADFWGGVWERTGGGIPRSKNDLADGWKVVEGALNLG